MTLSSSASKIRPGISLRLLPVLNRESWHAGKFPRIVGHQNGSHGEGMAGKEHVVRTDWLGIRTHCLERGAHFGSKLCRILIKILNGRHQASQKLQPGNGPFSIWTARCAVLQLKPCDCRQPAIEDIRVNLLRDSGIGSPGETGECICIEEVEHQGLGQSSGRGGRLISFRRARRRLAREALSTTRNPSCVRVIS